MIFYACPMGSWHKLVLKWALHPLIHLAKECYKHWVIFFAITTIPGQRLSTLPTRLRADS
jgi:hypothetical protein